MMLACEIMRIENEYSEEFEEEFEEEFKEEFEEEYPGEFEEEYPEEFKEEYEEELDDELPIKQDLFKFDYNREDLEFKYNGNQQIYADGTSKFEGLCEMLGVRNGYGFCIYSSVTCQKFPSY